MTRFDGDTDEMPVPPLDDRALEALLSGAPQSQSGFDWLVPFVEDLGEAASGPAPSTKPALAMLLAQGFPTENGAGLPATGVPKSRKKRVVSELLAGLVAQIAGLGLAAKAAMGLTLAAASTAAAGAAGVLPAPAQHAVATVVEAATPFSFPDKADGKASFGATVSADATGAADGTPGVDGKAVSDAAKAKHDAEASNAANTQANRGAGAGATGLDRANETPTAGHAPTSVPAVAGPAPVPGSQATKGLDTANSTPAAGKAPTSVPAVTPAAGLDTAGSTPAAGRVPTTPGRP